MMRTTIKLLRNDYLWLTLIIALALAVRVYKITIPLADHHSWRQADTAAVARNFATEEFNLFKPKMDNMAVQRFPYLPVNKERYFLAEFPIYNAAVAIMYKLFGVKEMFGRLVTVAVSLGTIIFLFLIARTIWGSAAGLFAALFFAITPYAVYFGRVILPEPTMIFFMAGSVYMLLRYQEKERDTFWVLLAAVLFSLALLVKVYAIVLLPAILYLFFRRHRFRLAIKKDLYLFLLIAGLPILLWRLYINTIPEGIPEYTWLFNQNHIRFTGAFFHWMIVERFDILMLTIGGMSLMLLGLIIKPEPKVGWFFHLWLVGLFIYSTILATGNVTHDYYQIIYLPIFMIFMAKASAYLVNQGHKLFSLPLVVIYLIFVVGSIVAFGWYEVRDFYNIQSGVDLAGAYINQNTPKNALIITGITADSTLLYNTNRHGWTIGFGSPYQSNAQTIETLRATGAQYYVTTRVSDLFVESNEMGMYLKNNYALEKSTDQYAVFNLTKRVTLN